jgi:hypothetical protein
MSLQIDTTLNNDMKMFLTNLNDDFKKKKVKTDRKEYMRNYQANKYKQNQKLLNETRLLNKHIQELNISKEQVQFFKDKYNKEELFVFCKTKTFLDKQKANNPEILKKVILELIKDYE